MNPEPKWRVTVCRKRYKVEHMGQAVCWIDLDKPNADEIARLIAAAPELLAALEWAESLLKERLEQDNIIRRAIASAKLRT